MLREKTLEAIGPTRQDPEMPGLLVTGFRAWAVGPPESASGEPMREELSPGRTRAVYDVAGGRIALDAVEHGSVDEAFAGLADHLEDNQLAEVPRGPEDLGEVAFRHPEQAPPAAFFVRGNLVLAVLSFGQERVDVLPYARRVDSELAGRPEEFREDGIEVTEKGPALRARPRWGGPDTYLKFLAPGGRLRKKEEEVVVEGEPDFVEIFAVEPGRETYGRRLRG